MPTLALLLCCVPTAGQAFERAAENRPTASGLVWLSDEGPPPGVGGHKEAPASPPAGLHYPVVAYPGPVAPLPATAPSAPARAVSGLVWVEEADARPPAVADQGPDTPALLTVDAPQDIEPDPETPAVFGPVARRAPAPRSSRLVWVAEDDPGLRIAGDPLPVAPQRLPSELSPAIEPEAATAGLAPAIVTRAPAPSSLRLEWVMDDEFSTLVAANPELQPHEILAAAVPETVSVEMVVQQLESEVPSGVLSHEALASLLLDPASPAPPSIDPASGSAVAPDPGIRTSFPLLPAFSAARRSQDDIVQSLPAAKTNNLATRFPGIANELASILPQSPSGLPTSSTTSNHLTSSDKSILALITPMPQASVAREQQSLGIQLHPHPTTSLNEVVSAAPSPSRASRTFPNSSTVLGIGLMLPLLSW